MEIIDYDEVAELYKQSNFSLGIRITDNVINFFGSSKCFITHSEFIANFGIDRSYSRFYDQSMCNYFLNSNKEQIIQHLDAQAINAKTDTYLFIKNIRYLKHCRSEIKPQAIAQIFSNCNEENRNLDAVRKGITLHIIESLCKTYSNWKCINKINLNNFMLNTKTNI